MKQFRVVNKTDLPEDQYNRLLHWYVTHNYDEINKETVGWDIEHKAIKLSIGEMIEFLDDHERWLTIERLHQGWGLFEDPTDRFDRKELRDSLWEAVKDTLANPK